MDRPLSAASLILALHLPTVHPPNTWPLAPSAPSGLPGRVRPAHRAVGLISESALVTLDEDDAAGPPSSEFRRPALNEFGRIGRCRLHDQPRPDCPSAHMVEKSPMLTAFAGTAFPAEPNLPLGGTGLHLTGLTAPALAAPWANGYSPD